MTKPAALSAALMAHRSYRRGSDNLLDDDLCRLSDAYPDLKDVFEELQFLRHENERLESESD